MKAARKGYRRSVAGDYSGEGRRFAVVVTDLVMKGTDGFAVLAAAKQHYPNCRIVMLTGHGTVDMCRRAFKAGAAEFLEKPVDDEALLEAVHNAVRDHVRTRQRDAAGRESRERYALLSPREREVLSLVVAGLTNKEIGRALVLSPRTVETHRAHLCTKLQVQTLAQMIRSYAQLVDDDAAAGPPA